jgi:hypothetical protein
MGNKLSRSRIITEHLTLIWSESKVFINPNDQSPKILEHHITKFDALVEKCFQYTDFAKFIHISDPIPMYNDAMERRYLAEKSMNLRKGIN